MWIILRVHPLTASTINECSLMRDRADFRISLRLFQIVSGAGAILTNWPEGNSLRELPPEELQNIVKTLRLREFNNEPFYAVPDVLAYALTVYIPFANDQGQELLLRAVFSMQSMKTELSRLMRLGASIVVLLLLLQLFLISAVCLVTRGLIAGTGLRLHTADVRTLS